MADEIYSELLYEGRHVSIASMPGMEPHAIVLDGFSKTYAMTGWRLGYGIMPAPLAEVVAKLQTNAVSCTATFTQKAGVAALKGDKKAVKAMRDEFRRRRDAIVAGLRKIPGFTCPQPKGAFYVFPNIARTGYSAAPPSASGARGISASATPTAWRTSRKPCAGSRTSSRSSSQRGGGDSSSFFTRIFDRLPLAS